MTQPPDHIPVLHDEVLDLLQPRPGDLVVDCTLGRGGHAAAFIERLAGHPDSRLIGIDLDPANIAHCQGRFADSPLRVELRHGSFLSVPDLVAAAGRAANVVLADLGFASTQMDDPARGFSFREEGPLDMRLDPTAGRSAADLLARISQTELADVIDRYGEEPLARKIARKVVQTRGQRPIQTTAELAQLVLEAYGPRARQSRMHPATRTFMALRIAVNDELAALDGLLDRIARGAESGGAAAWLAPGARIGVISFHSLEDRLVKRAFADMKQRDLGTIVTRKPITARAQEVQANPRARSAKLRVFRTADHADRSGSRAGRSAR
jgi:16S rRNA (cytosine1402-N4)-methyltransferase